MFISNTNIMELLGHMINDYFIFVNLTKYLSVFLSLVIPIKNINLEKAGLFWLVW